MGQNRSKSDPKLVFLPFRQVWFISFRLNYIRLELRGICLTTRRGKTRKKILRPKFGSNKPKSGRKLGFWLFSQVWFISFPLNCIG